MIKIFLKYFVLALFFIFNTMAPVPSSAQDIRFEATVNETTIALGDAVQLNLTLYGVKSSSPIELPAMDGFDVQYVGPSTRISIINGQYTSSVTLDVNLLPLKEGRFQIPSLNVSVGGQTYTTQAIDIEVVVGGQASGSSQTSASGPVQQSIQDRVFLTMSTPKAKAFVNEKIPLKMTLYVNGVSIQDIQYPELPSEGFMVDDFAEPRQYQEVRDGVRYEVVEFLTHIYPRRAGTWVVGPAQLNCNILSRRQGQRRSGFGSFESIFNDDFFGGAFDTFQKHPMTIRSDSLEVEALNVPEQGRTEGFSGAVGHFTFNVAAGPLEVNEGDPVTVAMSIIGDGNLDGIPVPVLKDSDEFKTYDPVIKGEKGQKVVEQVIIPKSENVKQIPMTRFSYFDPQTASYRTISQGPFDIVVKKVAGAESLKVVENNARGRESSPAIAESLGRDIVFLKEAPGSFRRVNRYSYKNPLLYIIMLFSLMIWGGVALAFTREQRLKTDIGYARRLHAPKKARAGLKTCQELLKQDQPREFYDAVFKTLQEYLADKFHLPMGNITVQSLQDKIQKPSANAANAVLDKLKIIFGACEAVRYASAVPDKVKMRMVFEHTQEIIDWMERFL